MQQAAGGAKRGATPPKQHAAEVLVIQAQPNSSTVLVVVNSLQNFQDAAPKANGCSGGL
jgi:hypothetical protein